MSEVTWFKVLTDIFSDDKIKIIQSMPEGDALLVMWFKVLSQAGKTNDGGYIYLKKNIPYTSGMLSTLFSKQQQLVELAMRTFVEFGMIDIDEKGYIFVTHWERHQSIDKLNQLKEKTNLRVQRHREKKKLELMECNVTETLLKRPINAVDLDIDLELDLEKEKHTTATTDKPNSFKLYETEKFGFMTPAIAEEVGALIDENSNEFVERAIVEASLSGVRTIKYVKGILRDWKATNHPEPWTLEKVQQSKQSNVKPFQRYNKPQKPDMPIVTESNGTSQKTKEEREAMRQLVAEMEQKKEVIQ